jgi:hypothetical protein
MSHNHLKGAAREALALSPQERIEFIRKDRWIGYDAARAVLNEVRDLISHPRNLRMPCRLVVGDPDNGKTMLLQECMKRHPEATSEADETRLPVLVFETPSEADEGRLYSAILSAMRIAHRPDASPETLLGKVIDGVETLDVRVLMGDEFHNILHGRPAEQRQLLASIKSLLNVLRRPFVAAGTRDAVLALAADTQFVTRFEQLVLPRWGLNMEVRRLLASLEAMTPLAEPSNLAERDLCEPIVLGGGGTIGSIIKIAKRSAVRTIESGKERITREIVEVVLAELRSRSVNAA